MARQDSVISGPRYPPRPPLLRGGDGARLRLAWGMAIVTVLVTLTAVVRPAAADAPVAMYVFPAGGQRGTEVKFRVGGLYLHESCPFEMAGAGVVASPRIT